MGLLAFIARVSALLLKGVLSAPLSARYTFEPRYQNTLHTHTIERYFFYFLDATFHVLEFRDSSRKRVLKKVPRVESKSLTNSPQ